ncbi:MAG: 5-formyltetrahydrofolate cyclo-ligase [Rhizobiales bacterium]|nr:5-formyltetrahydrofolate cyclo-ligase [Hyphomicrobiales bacterium]
MALSEHSSSEDSLSKQKAEIRRDILIKRNELPALRRIEMSLSAGDIGSKAIRFEENTIISGFFPIRSEIDARPLMDALAQRGARLCLPAVIDKTTIEFRELKRGCAMVDTGFGTRGPGPDAEILDPDIMIAPLAAYDMKGGRVGYGAGYYDRAIDKLMRKNAPPFLIGLAFAMQEMVHVPVEAHDIPLNAILTEIDYKLISTGKLNEK